MAKPSIKRFQKLMAYFADQFILFGTNGTSLSFDTQPLLYTGRRVLKETNTANGVKQLICTDDTYKTYIVKNLDETERWRVFNKNLFIGKPGCDYLVLAMDTCVPDEFKDLIEEIK